jgi:hypothetical protein
MSGSGWVFILSALVVYLLWAVVLFIFRLIFSFDFELISVFLVLFRLFSLVFALLLLFNCCGSALR